MLPFLKEKNWPRVAPESIPEKSYGFSEDDDLIDKALEDLIEAIDSGDSKKGHEALEALISLIHNKEHKDADVPEGA